MSLSSCLCSLSFFFNDTATTEIYTLSLHDALPIYRRRRAAWLQAKRGHVHRPRHGMPVKDRKSTRLNSSHSQISYAVFCLKKKKKAHKGTGCVDIAETLLTALTETDYRLLHLTRTE